MPVGANLGKRSRIGSVFSAATERRLSGFTGKEPFGILDSTQRLPTPELLLGQWDRGCQGGGFCVMT